MSGWDKVYGHGRQFAYDTLNHFGNQVRDDVVSSVSNWARQALFGRDGPRARPGLRPGLQPRAPMQRQRPNPIDTRLPFRDAYDVSREAARRLLDSGRRVRSPGMHAAHPRYFSWLDAQ